MQAEEAVEVEDVLARDVDAGPHRVVRALAVRHDDVEAVGRTTLKDDDQPLGTRAGFDCSEGGARQESRDGGCADDGQSAIAKKYAASDGHGEPQRRYQLSAFGCQLEDDTHS